MIQCQLNSQWEKQQIIILDMKQQLVPYHPQQVRAVTSVHLVCCFTSVSSVSKVIEIGKSRPYHLNYSVICS